MASENCVNYSVVSFVEKAIAFSWKVVRVVYFGLL